MARTIQSPHDRYVRALFCNVKVVKAFLRAHLSPELLAIVDLSTLVLQKEAFIDDRLGLKITDVLYAVKPFKGKSEILILIEHQSTQRRNFPSRISGYIKEIEQYYKRKNKTSITHWWSLSGFIRESGATPSQWINIASMRKSKEKLLGRLPILPILWLI